MEREEEEEAETKKDRGSKNSERKRKERGREAMKGEEVGGAMRRGVERLAVGNGKRGAEEAETRRDRGSKKSGKKGRREDQ